jgi:FkbM family methyltransferase
MALTIADHSQNGEFLELLKLIVAHGAPSKVIVDVGAHGRERSNSYDLLRLFGWRSLLIEANPALAHQIKSGFEGLDYALVVCAVSDFEGVGDLSLGVHSGISSLSPECTRAWGPISGSIEVPVRRLHKILDEHDIPKAFDVLSLDIEGHDSRVLNDLHRNSAYRPHWIIIEGSHNFNITDPTKIGVAQTVLEDYELVARTQVNLFLARNQK